MAINFIFEHQGKIKHHDQGVLNGILKNKWMRVPVRYNLMTIHYIYNRSKVMKYFQNHAEFYTEDELEKSRKNQQFYIIHRALQPDLGSKIVNIL